MDIGVRDPKAIIALKKAQDLFHVIQGHLILILKAYQF